MSVLIQAIVETDQRSFEELCDMFVVTWDIIWKYDFTRAHRSRRLSTLSLVTPDHMRRETLSLTNKSSMRDNKTKTRRIF